MVWYHGRWYHGIMVYWIQHSIIKYVSEKEDIKFMSSTSIRLLKTYEHKTSGYTFLRLNWHCNIFYRWKQITYFSKNQVFPWQKKISQHKNTFFWKIYKLACKVFKKKIHMVSCIIFKFLSETVQETKAKLANLMISTEDNIVIYWR